MELFSTVATWLLSKIADKGFEYVVKNIKTDAVSVELKGAVERVSEKLQINYPDVLGGSIEIFFKEEELFNELLKLLFRKSKVNLNTIKNNFDIQTLPENFVEEFVDNLKAELLKHPTFDRIFSDNEIYVSIIGIDENVEKIVQNTFLSMEDIKEIKQLLITKYNNSFNFDDFASNYSKTVINNLSQINYFGLGISPHITKNRKSLNDIYVKPSFLTYRRKRKNLVLTPGEDIVKLEGNKEKLEFKELFNSKRHIVLLGEPGAGKSLLVKYIICAILDKHVDEFQSGSVFGRLPFRIELRKYLAFKKENNCNITRYITNVVEFEYGISNITEDQIQNILSDKNTLVFFDGLDEIFDVGDKNAAKNDIENFITLHKNSVAFVTSRFIGYEDAALNDKFNIVEIMEFEEEQIEDYIRKWYSLEEPDELVRSVEIDELLSMQFTIEEELIKNPLLLSLIVILYRHNRELPTSRLEVYRSCTKTLVDKWDSAKKLELNINEKVKAAKENIFTNLAYWQYEKLSAKNKDTVNIRYIQVLNEVASIITRLKLSDNEYEAEIWAEEFLEYAKNRSIYFDNNFTHKTFLEFYSAFWIYKYYCLKGDTTSRNKVINKYIGNSFWSIVLELLINMIDEEQGDNEVIDELLESHIKKTSKAYIFLLRISPSIKHVSDNVLISLLKNSIYHCISKIGESKEATNIKKELFPLLKRILHNEKYNALLQMSVDQLVKDNLFNEEVLEKLSFFIFEIDTIQNLQQQFMHRSLRTNKIQFINGSNTSNKLDPDLFMVKMFRNKDLYIMNFLEFYELFGGEVLTLPYKNRFQDSPRWSALRFYCFNQFSKENIHTISKNLNFLESEGLSTKEIIHYTRRLRLSISPRMLINIIEDLAMTFNKIKNPEHLLFILVTLVDTQLYSRHSSFLTSSLNNLQNNVRNILKGNQFVDLFCLIFDQKESQNLLQIKLIFDTLKFDPEEYGYKSKLLKRSIS